MKLRVALLCLAVVAVVLIAWAVRRSGGGRPESESPVSPVSTPDTSAVAPAPASAVPLQAPASATPPRAASPPASVEAPPQQISRQPYQPPNPLREEAEAIALNLRSFGQRFGGNPVGTNAEIVKTLNGGNPQGVRYLPQESLRLNDQGELLDSFGTPYFFHQLSSTEMEIRSAGPDKTLWTQDDIAVK